MDVALAAVAGARRFLDSPAPYLLLDRDLQIRAANAAYLAATGRDCGELLGQDMFAAFPNNPADLAADGAERLSASLERVLRTGTAHDMLAQRYDIHTGSRDRAARDRAAQGGSPEAALGTASGRFVSKTWSPFNSPVRDEHGHTVGVVHHVEDISDVDELLSWGPFEATAAASTAGPQPLTGHNLRRDPIDGALPPQAALRARLRQLGAQAAHARVELDTSARHSQRLTDALIAVLAARGLAGPTPLQHRREQLWRQLAADAREHTWRGWADALCQLAVQRLPGVQGAALTVRTADGRHQELLAASDKWSADLDALHLTAGQGPALTAMSTGTPMLIPDLTAQHNRWPWYVAAARSSALAAVHVFPLRVHHEPIATLALFSRHAGALSPLAAADAAILADLAAATATHDLDAAFTGALSDQPEDRSGPAHHIAQATGMVMARYDLSLDDARDRLRAAAFSRDIPVARLAADIINGRGHLD